MKCFVNEEERKNSRSTCYFEFQKGKYKNKNWLKDSVSLHVDIFDDFEFYSLFSYAIDRFDCFEQNEVSKKQWDKIIQRSKKTSNGKLLAMN